MASRFKRSPQGAHGRVLEGTALYLRCAPTEPPISVSSLPGRSLARAGLRPA
jgi:hypothetical protein